MKSITYIDRNSGKLESEKVYGGAVLGYLYGNSHLGRAIKNVTARNPIFSRIFGWWQRKSWTRRKIVPFITKYQIDPSEFAEDVSSFRCFDDFFIRKLKADARPIDSDPKVAVIPADGRYLFFNDIAAADGFLLKGKKFDLDSLLQNKNLAEEYQHGSLVIARLCPSDYHRFHFPVDGIPSASRLINGWLYSVNPIALKQNIDIFTENKRAITEIESETFGKVLFIEVGATNVGSIIQTYEPSQYCKKGAEKGYFSFGASSLLILFPKGKITFSKDLIDLGKQGYEIRCLMGQRMGQVK
jgi:phosphatidylserine decarboxylase